MAVDNLAIPEIDWTDDGDSAGDWMLDGWSSVDNILPQQWIVQGATIGSQAVSPRVRRLVDAGDDLTNTGAASTGTWRIALGEGETLILAISAANDNTSERATFTLGIKNG